MSFAHWPSKFNVSHWRLKSASIKEVVFSKKVVFIVNGEKSLKSFKIGILRGDVIAEKMTRGMNRTLINQRVQLFKLLQAERIDIAIAGEIEGLATLKSIGIENIKILNPPLAEVAVYHYLNKKHISLVPNITNAFSSWKESGRHKLLMEQYIKDLHIK